MKLKNKYDTIIVGDGIGGLLSAIYLLRAGKKVAVITERHEHHTHFADVIRYFTGLSDGFLFHQVLSELKIDCKDIFQKLPVIVQIVTDNTRVNIPYSGDELSIELKRGLQNEHSIVFDLYNAVYNMNSSYSKIIEPNTLGNEELNFKKHIGTKYKLNSKISNLGRNNSEEALVAQMHISSFSDCANDELTTLQFFKLAYLTSNGVYIVKGGIDSFTKLLKDEIKHLGGSIKDNSIIDDLLIENNNVAGIVLSSFDGLVRADSFIVSSDSRKFLDKIESKGEKEKPDYWKFLQKYRIKKNSIPIGVGQNLIYSPKLEGGEPNPVNSIRLVIDTHQEGYDEILAEVRLAYSEEIDLEFLRIIGRRLYLNIKELFPYFDENLLEMYPDFRKGKEDFEKLYNGEIHYDLREYSYKKFDKFGICGIPIKTSSKNIFICGRENFPGLGVYGEVFAAKKVIAELLFNSKN